ncbi:MAG: glycoside hydrolase family 31 protein [Chthoniobacteraceae bacterium]
MIATPGAVDCQISERGDSVSLTTAKVCVQVDKHTGQVRFLNRDGSTALSEARGPWLSSATVGAAKDTTIAGQQFVLDPKEAIYGLGQHPEDGKMNYVGSHVKLQQQNTKIAIPMLISSKGYGVFWDNPAVTDVDVGGADKGLLAWHSEAGFGVNYYFLQGAKPDEAIAGYRWLTGAAPLFGKWAWGFWQSRERYKTQDEILGIVAEYRMRGIPLDGIIQDWQYWAPLNQETAEGGWGSHEFDKTRYPDPAAMIKGVHDQHAHFMVVSWAKFDVTTKKVSIPNLRALEAVNGAFNPAIPYAFPAGQGKWYDPFNDQARAVYWNLMSTHLFSLGVDAWWLDASEAELSGKWGEFRDFKTGKGPGPVVFNAYPLEHTRAVYEGQRGQSSDKRVLILTRSAYAGQQRNGAISWSGDIQGKWEVLQNQIPAGLNFTASGVPYWNTDIGGFFGGDPLDPKYSELFTRWFQFGSFCPMFRVHGTNKPKEVWRFDEATQKILTDYIALRYHLLPYIYSVSWMVTHDGYTMMRPLVMDFPGDPAARNIPDQFMFGPGLLVAPVTHPGAQSRSVYLPQGTSWTDFWTGKTYAGGQQIEAAAPIQTLPLFVKAGTILPYGPDEQYAQEKSDPIELRIYPGADGRFTLYEDEGDNYDYEKGAYATTTFHWDDRKQQLTIDARQGDYPGLVKEHTFRVVRVSATSGRGVAASTNEVVEIKYQGAAMHAPVPAAKK